MREDDLGRYQMLWDCPSCGTEGLLGVDHRFCPNCGTPQDPKLRYFPSDAQKVLVEDHAYHGADWVCPACDTPNSAQSEFCVACGSPADGASSAVGRKDVVVGDGQSFGGETARDASAEARERRQRQEARRRARMSGQPPETKKRGGFMGIGLLGGCVGIIALFVVVCIGFYALSYLLQSTDKVTVESHTWTRSIDIEAYGPVQKKAWRDRVPRGANVISCRSEKRDTKKVQDGEDCRVRKKDKGDGTFSETRECSPVYKNVDVMDDRCTYTVLDWKKVRAEQAAGSDLSPSWPRVSLKQTGTCEGCEREGDRSEIYTVRVKDSKGQLHTCQVAERRWSSLSKGTQVEAAFGGLTGAIDCGSL